ncbi:protocatechuate 3,4-dioxygenase [Sorangium sp. So ce764]|uniref:dioxygenase family protein n=1 Tax=Sorangium sp. So ce764 TaxID=3133320 RepID=UPI003F609D25
MRNSQGAVPRDLLDWVFNRRQPLVKLGAFAITRPVLVSCREDDERGGDLSGSGTGGGGGTWSGPGSSGSSTAGPIATSSSSAGGGVGAGGADALDPSIFKGAGSCRLTATDIGGPFFIDDSEIPNDISLFRSDIRDDHPGCELRLYVRLLDARNNHEPIPDAEVYIWHCDADGQTSSFERQGPSTPSTGAAERTPESQDRFCRGVQLSDRNGIVGFKSIYPGSDAGRPVHVHMLARINGATTRLITTQLYFDADLSAEVFQKEPAYAARSANLPASGLNPPPGSVVMPATYTSGLITSILNIIVDA